MPQLLCDNLTLGYEGKEIVTGLSFTVNTGDYLCVVGENGSGKSTLMKTIVSLKPPMSGRVIFGDDITINQLGYMPQQTAAQKDFPATVREVVRSGFLNRCGLRPYYKFEEKYLADEVMERVGIGSIAKECYRDLSGGQQQRTLLARALCATQKMLLLDEPASGLDPYATLEMYEMIKAFNTGGITIVMISHDVSSSIKYATHILHIVSQNSFFYGTTADYLQCELGRFYSAIGGE
jgi:zinc transport system ATP-binding protein